MTWATCLSYEEYVFQTSQSLSPFQPKRCYEDQDANLSKGPTLSLCILSFLGRSPFSLYPGLSFPQSSSAASREDFLPPGSHPSGHGAGSDSAWPFILHSTRHWCQVLATEREKEWGPYPQELTICWGARPGCRSQ